MGRAPCCNGGHSVLKKGPWTHEEDQQLRSFLLRNTNTSWRLVPEKAGLVRCGKSCRLRWMNYLRPDIIRGNFSAEEENLIVELHATLGNKWSIIATHLPGRTDNEIKNLWNTRLKKFLVMKGIDPTTHQPLITPYSPDCMNQWAKSRMELAEAQIALAEYLKLKGLPQTCTNGYPLNHAEKPESSHMEMNYWVEGGFSGIKNVGGREMLKGHRVEMGEILKYGWGEELDSGGEREGFKGAAGGNPPPALDSTEIWMERDERLAY